MKKKQFSENIEKYVLAGMAVAAGLQLSAMAWIVTIAEKDTQAGMVTMGGYVGYAIVVILAMSWRKISKYVNLTKLHIGPDGIDMETSEKGEDIEAAD